MSDYTQYLGKHWQSLAEFMLSENVSTLTITLEKATPGRSVTMRVFDTLDSFGTGKTPILTAVCPILPTQLGTPSLFVSIR